MAETRELNDRIRAMAARQHGIVTRAQLLEAGLSSAAVGRRLAAGRLRPVHRGVYRFGPLEPEPAREMAAALAGGPTAVVSHMNAGWLWRLVPTRGPGPVHVTVPGSGRSSRPGIRFHRAALSDDEREIVHGIPVTTPGRTLADLAGVLGSREVEQAAAVAERRELIAPDELGVLPERYRGRPGIAALRDVSRERTGPRFTRSELEIRCLRLFDGAGLPRPRTNVRIGPYEIDLYWPDLRVAVEIDGRAYHSDRLRFEGDRRKDAWLRARGIQVVRLTWRQVTGDGLRTAVQVGQTLALARSRRDREDP